MKEKNAEDDDNYSEKEETHNIISFYKNLSATVNNPTEKIEIIDCIS
jgi:hypothetical protein